MDMFSFNARAFFSIANMYNTIPTSSLNSAQTKQSLQSMGINTNYSQYKAATANMGKFGGLGHTTQLGTECLIMMPMVTILTL